MTALCGALAGLVLAAASTTAAAAGERSQARAMVADMAAAHSDLLDKFPELGRIDRAIRADCSATNPGIAETSDFCGCAAAVTMQMWRSGVDPAMIGRLQEYLNSPGDSAAQAFLAYQGPELYKPLCSLAAPR